MIENKQETYRQTKRERDRYRVEREPEFKSHLDSNKSQKSGECGAPLLADPAAPAQARCGKLPKVGVGDVGRS